MISPERSKFVCLFVLKQTFMFCLMVTFIGIFLTVHEMYYILRAFWCGDPSAAFSFAEMQAKTMHFKILPNVSCL